jgi:hypothetical protein
VYGDQDEVCFIYTESRAHRHVGNILRERFSGTIVSDGYAAYARYAQHNEAVTSAQCWTHTRRYFFDAQDSEPQAASDMLELIKTLYRHEDLIAEQGLTGEAKLHYRITHSKPVVEYIYAWVNAQRQRADLLPKDLFSKAWCIWPTARLSSVHF